MKVQHHTAVSLILAALVGWWQRSWAAGLACVLSGVLVDGDHVLDYVWNRPGPFQLRRFFKAFERELLDRIFVLLHSWELVLAGALTLMVVPAARRPALIGLWVGFAAHLTLDNIFNQHSRWAYCLFYRAWHRFEGRRFYGTSEYRARRRYMRQQPKHTPAEQPPCARD